MLTWLKKSILDPLLLGYRELFSIHEIEQQSILKWMMGGSLLFFFICFNRWMMDPVGTLDSFRSGMYVCWPYLKNCTDFYFYAMLPYSYTQTTFYMLLFGIMGYVVYCIGTKKFLRAHILMVFMLMWEIIWVFIYSYPSTAPYYYYHIFLTSILLFIPHKEYFLKLGFVMLYFMSATIKLDEAWVLGTYFSSLKTGLPLIPSALIPVATNIVISSQILLCWFLLSKRVWLQRSAVSFFIFFHLYSGIFVTYFYPTSAMPALVILFTWMYRYTPAPFTRRSVFGWVMIALLVTFQAFGFSADAERKLTLQADRLGMFMFEANHQCAMEFTTTLRNTNKTENTATEVANGTPCNKFYCTVKTSSTWNDGITTKKERIESGTSWNRCDPYEWWTRLNTRCDRNPDIEKISVQYDHSINGGPFYRIIDVDNICALEYNMFRANDWVKGSKTAPIMGYPVSNYYHY